MFKNLLLIVLVMNAAVLVACTTAEKRPQTTYTSNIEQYKASNLQPAHPVPLLRIATLNIAHGRKESLNQLFVRKSTFQDNLDDIAAVLNKYRPHIVALQEADAPSLWSGSFDHVSYLASTAEYPWQTHVSNAVSWLYQYGTALLSELPIIETIKHTFKPSPPTLDKGFVLAQVEWHYGEGYKPRKVDVISMHLDFSRQSVREQQLNEVLEILSTRANPTIIMGDFNSEWLADVSVIKELAVNSRFRTYEPQSDEHNSYKDKRLDWILITSDMEFVNYQVLPDTLSDHSMIIADIRFKESNANKFNSISVNPYSNAVAILNIINSN